MGRPTSYYNPAIATAYKYDSATEEQLSNLTCLDVPSPEVAKARDMAVSLVLVQSAVWVLAMPLLLLLCVYFRPCD